MADPSPNETSNVSPTASTAPRRRSSSFMPAFESLSQLRETQASTARRQSHCDQQPKAGYIGQLFHNNFGRNIGK